MWRWAPARSLPGLTAQGSGVGMAGEEHPQPRNQRECPARLGMSCPAGNVLPSQECGRAAGGWEGVASLCSLIPELISPCAH